MRVIPVHGHTKTRAQTDVDWTGCDDVARNCGRRDLSTARGNAHHADQRAPKDLNGEGSGHLLIPQGSVPVRNPTGPANDCRSAASGDFAAHSTSTCAPLVGCSGLLAGTLPGTPKDRKSTRLN